MQNSTQPALDCVNRTDHAKGVQQCTEGEHNRECCQVFTPGEITNSRSHGIAQQLAAGQSTQNTNVVVRTGMDAVQTKCAVHVADLPRLKQRQLAATDDDQIRRWFTAASDAILGMATGAHILITYLYFQGRKCRRNKIELTYRTHELAKRSVLEESVHHQHGDEVGKDQPGCPPRRRPQIE